MPKKRGRPPSANPLVSFSMRMDADLLAHYRATGKGWMTRMGQDIRNIAIKGGFKP